MRLVIIAAFLIASCGNNQNASENKTSKDSTAVKRSDNIRAVRNDIELTPVALKVNQAFLMFEDGRLVPEGNKVEIGQKVLLRLIIEDWKPVNGKVRLGASEKIETSEGQLVLDEPDLFAELNEGVDPKDARAVTLTAVITGVDKLYDHFKVSFRVWDKNSEDEISGSYKLYLK